MTSQISASFPDAFNEQFGTDGGAGKCYLWDPSTEELVQRIVEFATKSGSCQKSRRIVEVREVLLFEALIENSCDVISLVTAGGEILFASGSSVRVFGYRPEELLGLSAFDLFHPEDCDHLRRAFREVLAKPPCPQQLEARIRQKNGQSCWVESTISNLLDEPSIGGIIVNCREISARRAVRDQAQHQTDDLTRSNADLEEFAYAVAHDLREPLRTISMFTEVLVNDGHLDEHDKVIAHFIIEGVKRVSTLFEGLHAFAVRGFDELPQPMDLGQVVAEAVKNLGHAITGSGATVTVGPLPWVQGDEKQLLRVFQNLMANAIKYRGKEPAEIHVTADRMGPDWIVKVKDNGIGIAPEHHESVFRLLKRLNATETPGAGFGLAICKKIVEALGGTIWVESEPGAGSTFCFTIAATKEQAAFSATAEDGGVRHYSIMKKYEGSVPAR